MFKMIFILKSQSYIHDISKGELDNYDVRNRHWY